MRRISQLGRGPKEPETLSKQDKCLLRNDQSMYSAITVKMNLGTFNRLDKKSQEWFKWGK